MKKKLRTDISTEEKVLQILVINNMEVRLENRGGIEKILFTGLLIQLGYLSDPISRFIT